MNTETRDRFVILDGYWIPVKDVTHVGSDGAFLRDGRFIARDSK